MNYLTMVYFRGKTRSIVFCISLTASKDDLFIDFGHFWKLPGM